MDKQRLPGAGRVDGDGDGFLYGKQQSFKEKIL